jgi:hypothetical protein
MDHLLKFRDSLLSIATHLGFALEDVRKGERPDRICIDRSSDPSGYAAGLNTEELLTFARLGQDALELFFRAGDLPLLTLSESTSREDIEHLKERLAELNLVEIEIVVRKQALVDALKLEDGQRKVRWYCFTSRFADLLRDTLGSPEMLEQALWGDEIDRPCFVFLLDEAVSAQGAWLKVIGLDQEVMQLAPPLLTRDELRRIHAAAHDHVRLDAPATKDLLPHHLRMTHWSSGSSTILALLASHWANSSIATICDRLRKVEGSSDALFFSEHRSASVRLIGADEVSAVAFGQSLVCLGDLVEWAYDPSSVSDRARMAGLTVSTYMGRHKQPCLAVQLVQEACAILSDVKWKWRSFINKELRQYTSDEQRLEEEVGNTVDAHGAEIGGMITSLSTTVLGAVGILIGTFVAFVVTDKFNADLLRWGIAFYIGYLVIFPGAFGMLHHLQRYSLLRETFKEKRSRYRLAIDPDRVDEIVGTRVERSCGLFWRWFIASIIALACVIMVCTLMAIYAPSWIEDRINKVGDEALESQWMLPSQPS